MMPCLPFDQLERLLDEQLAERDQEALADHVEGCPSCRRRLEDLAVAWTARPGKRRLVTGEYLLGPAATSAAASAMRPAARGHRPRQ